MKAIRYCAYGPPDVLTMEDVPMPTLAGNHILVRDLAVLRKLLEDEKVAPVIGKTYTLSEVPEAIRYLEQGHATGKVVITM